ncbi:MAG TPA: restriction endonuclease [Pseudonocardia sp.]|uniref:restriction endonuclease n=1 Tax=Pseudonocardia sp. TaxID=60912 RepID=UPI002B62A7FE|nr:restriction endonuclease [Pseudonocardia sp.]HTF46024.1 restriction endonuclease [Pseudonocardia sp.]
MTPIREFDLTRCAFVDGIDAVVINRNSVVGGLTVIQVKQYSRVLGVSHIRELVGAHGRETRRTGHPRHEILVHQRLLDQSQRERSDRAD